MSDNFPKLNIRDREDQKFRNATGEYEVKVAVEVENDSNNAIPVYVTDSPSDIVINEYDEVTGVVPSILTTLVTYTVPVGKSFDLSYVEGSGTNVARYTVVVDGVTISSKRTWWSGPFNAEFEFNGYEVSSNSVIQLKVFHTRPMNGDFEARINGVLT